MKKAKEFLMVVNGKKLPISMIIAGSIAVGVLQAEVGNLKEDIDALEPLKEQVARIDERGEALKEDIEDIKYEQREMRTDIKAIYKAVVK